MYDDDRVNNNIQRAQQLYNIIMYAFANRTRAFIRHLDGQTIKFKF